MRVFEGRGRCVPLTLPPNASPQPNDNCPLQTPSPSKKKARMRVEPKRTLNRYWRHDAIDYPLALGNSSNA